VLSTEGGIHEAIAVTARPARKKLKAEQGVSQFYFRKIALHPTKILVVSVHSNSL